MPPPSERDLSLSSGRLHAREHGPADGPLAIGIPGLSANVVGFDALGPRLAADGRRLVALDLRGRGRSDITPPGTYGLPAHAQDVVAAADALARLDAFDVIGWSMGALVAMHVAALAPDRVRRVVLVDHAGRVDDAALGAVRRGLDRLDAVVPSPEPYLEAIRAAGAAAPWDDLWARFYTYELGPAQGGGLTPTTSKAACTEDLDRGIDVDAQALWAGLTMPTLLVRANAPLGGGFVVPEDQRDAMAAAVPGLRVFESERNHFGVMTDPGAIEAVADLLAGT
jgi:pimeloyl-ACP methyl ester carboxylesterase